MVGLVVIAFFAGYFVRAVQDAKDCQGLEAMAQAVVTSSGQATTAPWSIASRFWR